MGYLEAYSIFALKIQDRIKTFPNIGYAIDH